MMLDCLLIEILAGGQANNNMTIEKKYIWKDERTYTPIDYIKLDFIDYSFIVFIILTITGGLIN